MSNDAIKATANGLLSAAKKQNELLKQILSDIEHKDELSPHTYDRLLTAVGRGADADNNQ